MTNQLRIGNAIECDVSIIASLWAELTDGNAEFDSRFRRNDTATTAYADFIKRRLAQPEHCVSVADYDGDVVGYSCASVVTRPPLFVQREYGFISDVVVAVSRRRRGIGSLLADSALTWLSVQGCSRVELRALNASDAAIRFWESRGFQPYMTTMRKQQP
jgi:GNAT superfamily N-acetyltransferase